MSKLAQRRRDFWRLWLAIVVVGLGVTLFAWVAVQQSLRLSANDSQWQLAEDAAAQLASGTAPSAVVPAGQLNEAASLAPFLTITDRNLNVLATSGIIDGRAPLPPTGSFQTARTSGSNWFTWQHNGGVRDAAVIVPYGGAHPGYVLAARSLKQVESNEAQIQHLALMAMLGVLAAPALVLLVL